MSHAGKRPAVARARWAESLTRRVDVDRDALADAEDALWAWYLEWGPVARSAITDKNHLRELGFLKWPPPPGANFDTSSGAAREVTRTL